MKTHVSAGGRLSVRQEGENFELGCSETGSICQAVRKKEAYVHVSTPPPPAATPMSSVIGRIPASQE